MSLQAGLKRVLAEYALESTRQLEDNPLADCIRHELPQSISKIIDDDERYKTKGSPGLLTNWANVPWVAVFDRFITETAQDGYYLVYLFKEDLTGVYLSLNQGITTVKSNYGSDAKNALVARASDYLAKIGYVGNAITGPIGLAVSNNSGLGAYYERGSICAKYYASDNIPSDDVLSGDLEQMLSFYKTLSTNELVPSNKIHNEEDEVELELEDLTRLREHKRIERNRSLAKKVKKVHGYTCAACHFNFEKMYGEIGKGFIEAHHLTPLNTLKGQKFKLNPKSDFAVLCSNCHKMIHKTTLVSDVPTFRLRHLRK